MNQELVFNKNGKFKILQLTDVHYTEDKEPDHRSVALIRRIIREEQPDFIILTGDTVYGPDNLKNIGKALEPVTESGIPWSYTFGNHDTEEGVGYEELMAVITQLPGCRMYHAKDSGTGYGNHYLEVQNAKNMTKWVLFGMDSGSYNPIKEVGGYGYVDGSQISWYRQVIKALEQREEDKEVTKDGGKEVAFAALTFMHIPLPEYNTVWDTQVCYGEKREEICAPLLNSGFFTAMLEAGHTKGVFAGHDHINDYMGSLYGIILGYGRATGYNTYSQEGYLHGARVIVLDENNTETFETYQRLEDGSILQEPKVHQPEEIE